MGAHAVVTLILAAVAITAAAAYLTNIILILWQVSDRLVTVLWALEGVSERAEPAGSVIDDINRDLESSAKALEDCVRRLAERRGVPAGAAVATNGERAAATHSESWKPVPSEPGSRGFWRR